MRQTLEKTAEAGERRLENWNNNVVSVGCLRMFIHWSLWQGYGLVNTMCAEFTRFTLRRYGVQWRKCVCVVWVRDPYVRLSNPCNRTVWWCEWVSISLSLIPTLTLILSRNQESKNLRTKSSQGDSRTTYSTTTSIGMLVILLLMIISPSRLSFFLFLPSSSFLFLLWFILLFPHPLLVIILRVIR